LATITFIGAGHVAWHLAQALEDAGHSILEIYSRNSRHAQQLAEHLYDAQPVHSLNFADSHADVFIIAVPDDAVPSVVETAVFPVGAIICHTSGTLPLAAFKTLPNCGVFYPLQTFSKNRPVMVNRVPFCLEASNETTENILVAIAQSISQTVYLVSSEERKILHIGAVFACNFTNHLLVLARLIVEKEHLEFDLLKPLIEETFAKALATEDPATVQTGPAIRGDAQTIASHLKYLKANPVHQKIYKLLTESIRKTSGTFEN